ncbi:MAG TPA: alpha/beta hydrolase [Myxococcota bacterium]|jgi:pimeloyl-ACP methyl ester carboxylesterase
MTPRDFFVQGSSGNAIHCLEWSSEGVPLVLVHGFGNEAHIWDDLAKLVAPHYRVVAIDQRGHGDSAHDPELRYDYDFLVADLEAVTRALGIERFVLVGHSLGGRASMLFAGEHPERMAGLVIVDSAPEFDVRGTTRIRQEAEGRGDGSVASVAEYQRVLAHNFPAGRPESLARMAKHELKLRADGRFERKLDPKFHAGRPQSEAEVLAREREIAKRLWDALAKIPCPTLVVRGAASDVMSPEVADKMVDDVLPRGTLAIVPQAAHSVMTDNPDGFNRAVCAFVLGE